ncbi:hypothetical protein DPEC_G00155980 [Dallia pectoralis]|uniref:Uncharacterized protein n=1 Tax=Dallia pectoralis TaxID=75939 RepID=A0ACC2GK86_DALPE|nr:hypothetical protein DPEC_G00155980 [Dallia pectoralis]
MSHPPEHTLQEAGCGQQEVSGAHRNLRLDRGLQCFVLTQVCSMFIYCKQRVFLKCSAHLSCICIIRTLPVDQWFVLMHLLFLKSHPMGFEKKAMSNRMQFRFSQVLNKLS